jgi:hypothetical protein
MKQVLLKIALFFGLLMVPFVALFISPYSEEFAYHFIKDDCYNHGAWIFDRITRNPTPIDVAFIGSSHSIHAFQEKRMEELLDSNFHFANLGYCRYGRNLEFVLLKLLLKNKSPKIIILEVHEDEEKNSHDIFPYLAETKDLLLPPTPINRDYFSDLFYGASARLECFKAKYIFRKRNQEPNTNLYGYGPSDRTVKEEELKENEKAWEKRLKQTKNEAIEKLQIKYPLAYLEKMIGLIKEKNIRLLFVYLPESGSKLTSPKHSAYYQNAGPLLIPPQYIFDDVANWMDASHLNDKGSALLSTWMAERLKSELCLNPEY